MGISLDLSNLILSVKFFALSSSFNLKELKLLFLLRLRWILFIFSVGFFSKLLRYEEDRLFLSLFFLFSGALKILFFSIFDLKRLTLYTILLGKLNAEIVLFLLSNLFLNLIFLKLKFESSINISLLFLAVSGFILWFLLLLFLLLLLGL